MYILYGIFHFGEIYNYKNIFPTFIITLLTILLMRICIGIIPDLYVDFLERGARISMDEEGIKDNRVSNAKMNWRIFSALEILGGPMSGISTVRLRKKKEEYVQYRKFSIQSLLNASLKRDEYIYINMKNFSRDPKYISENMKMLFEKAHKS